MAATAATAMVTAATTAIATIINRNHQKLFLEGHHA